MKKITKYYAVGLFVVREDVSEVPSRYAKEQKYLRTPDFFAVREAFFCPTSRDDLIELLSSNFSSEAIQMSGSS
ncbi:hypothetical protein E3N88_25022 [Mikania micrantha]|uniref:Uncharacterized protein n=1 Tax=Mikania micrantha TaxID=192012 RepID=A0A5N6N3T5_9ASTR|nr:hypothetical protein E3N88_25022 [Mikania micrantha]